jgi:hypothetical protein
MQFGICNSKTDLAGWCETQEPERIWRVCHITHHTAFLKVFVGNAALGNVLNR